MSTVLDTIDLDAIPVIRRDTYIRHDNEGVSILITAECCQPLLVNRTVTGIINLVDGQRTVAECIDVLCQRYPKVARTQLQTDTIHVLQFLIEQGGVKLLNQSVEVSQS
jgi:hypothetical protein